VVRKCLGYLALDASGIFFLASSFFSTNCKPLVKTRAVSGPLVVMGCGVVVVVVVVVVGGCGAVGGFLVVLLSILSIHSLVERFDITFSNFSILVLDF